ncbi:MAG: hypothetical protein QOK43_1690, partial [Acidimicrobiaceae bacterium]|nr:hypothetical protein [Acidimicrobiaceae bacterium]
MTEDHDELRRRLRAYGGTARVSGDAWARITARTGGTLPQDDGDALLPSPTVAPRHARHARHARPTSRTWPRRVLI